MWYFPALMLSLFVLKKWKEKYKLNYLFIISFFLLLFGATETYYGLLPLSIKELVTYYFNIFFTTRNFLFFGLFYVVLGYKMGLKDNVYSKNCFVKLIVSCFFLIFEAIILHDFHRLDSNILLPLSIKELVTYYFNIFFTTRNFLFFGLFYVVLGYKMGLKDNVYSKNCFVKLIVSCFFLIFEAIILHDFHRLDSNILLSCIPVTYYLFISVIYITNHINLKIKWSQYSKYYYLLHPMMIFIVSFIFKEIGQYLLLNIVVVLMLTHILSFVMIKKT